MMLHLSRHNDVCNLLALKVTNQFPKLADSDPFNLRSTFGNSRVGFFFDCGHGHLYAAPASAFQYIKRKTAVACYEPVLHEIVFNVVQKSTQAPSPVAFALR